MNRPTEAALFAAHPGDELLVHGLLQRMSSVARYGRDADRIESFRRVADWKTLHPSRREHRLPLRHALRASVENGQFVS